MLDVVSSGVKKVKALLSSLIGNPLTELQDVTCDMGSHNVTCHPTQAKHPALTPASEAGTQSIYLPRRDGRLS